MKRAVIFDVNETMLDLSALGPPRPHHPRRRTPPPKMKTGAV
jgi:hypothetical protein